MELPPLQVPLSSLLKAQMVGVKYQIDRCVRDISDSNPVVKDPNTNGNQNLLCHSISEQDPYDLFEECDHQ